MSFFGIYGYFFNSTPPSEVHENTLPSTGSGTDAESGRVVNVLPGISQNEALQRSSSRPGSPAAMVSVAENAEQELSEREVTTSSSSSAQVPAESPECVLAEAKIQQCAEQIMLAKTPDEISQCLAQLEACDAYIISRVLATKNEDSCTIGESFISKPEYFSLLLPALLKLDPLTFHMFLSSKDKNGSSLMEIAESKPEYISLVEPKINQLKTDLKDLGILTLTGYLVKLLAAYAAGSLARALGY